MKRHNYPLHILLFIASVFTTMLAGAELVTGKMWLWGGETLGWEDLSAGGLYAFSFLTFLTFHEFGHYFTAVYHKVKCSLPYYIPIFIPLPTVNIGSFGALIRIREVPDTRQKFFDIGVAGPLAGFVISVILLVVGFSTLPVQEDYIYPIHPEYAEVGHIMTADEVLAARGEGAFLYEVGSNMLLTVLKAVVPSDPGRVPPAHEMMHYPLLFVGFLTLFFTALNLLPIGQLDGGHVVYGLFGPRLAGIISRVTVVALLIIGGTGLVTLDEYTVEAFGEGQIFYWSWEIGTLLVYLLFLVFILRKVFALPGWVKALGAAGLLMLIQGAVKFWIPEIPAYGLWLLYAFMAVRVIGLDHPVTAHEEPLSTGRKVLGWLAIILFIICFTPFPLIVLG